MPMASDPTKLAPAIAELRERFDAAGRGNPQVVVLGGIPSGDPERALDWIRGLEEIGVTGFIQGLRYETADEFAAGIEPAAQVRAAL